MIKLKYFIQKKRKRIKNVKSKTPQIDDFWNANNTADERLQRL